MHTFTNEVIAHFPQEKLLEIVKAHKKEEDAVDIASTEQVFTEILGAHIAVVSKQESSQSKLP